MCDAQKYKVSHLCRTFRISSGVIFNASAQLNNFFPGECFVASAQTDDHLKLHSLVQYQFRDDWLVRRLLNACGCLSNLLIRYSKTIASSEISQTNILLRYFAAVLRVIQYLLEIP
mgnify:CR=1 FL=1